MIPFNDRIVGYAAYHRNPKNKFTHLFGVPMVFYSPLIAFNWIRFDFFNINFGVGNIILLCIMLWYFSLDWKLATLMSIISIPVALFMEYLSQLDFKISLTYFLGLNILGWAIQLLGHYYEGRKPALADNLIQSLMGPIFVLLEVLFFFGFKKDLEKEIHDRVEAHPFHNKKTILT
jgi:uncharacterized membrane protein YGL010W